VLLHLSLFLFLAVPSCLFFLPPGSSILILLSINEQQGRKSNSFKVTAHCYFTFTRCLTKMHIFGVNINITTVGMDNVKCTECHKCMTHPILNIKFITLKWVRNERLYTEMRTTMLGLISKIRYTLLISLKKNHR
jgi:hypothetical protein